MCPHQITSFRHKCYLPPLHTRCHVNPVNAARVSHLSNIITTVLFPGAVNSIFRIVSSSATIVTPHLVANPTLGRQLLFLFTRDVRCKYYTSILIPLTSPPAWCRLHGTFCYLESVPTHPTESRHAQSSSQAQRDA